VYVVGGVGNNHSTVYYAKLNSDGSVGTWSINSKPIPNIIYNDSRAIVANGYLYVLGSTNLAPQYAKLNSDGSLGAWTAAGATQTTQAPSTFVANGYVYVIGGLDGSANPRSSVYYAKLNSDGSIGSWRTNSNYLPTTVELHSSFVSNGYVYVIGGDANGSNYQSLMVSYYYLSSIYQFVHLQLY
jgi:N-acetylneuraminic acid mutarotase